MNTDNYHSLLNRQLRKHFPNTVPAELQAFLRDINQAYTESDQDRNMLERALDITSAEMMSVYENLKRDMEKRLAVERELSEAKQRMLAAGKHEALGRLAANVAHDFNNILAIIRTTADILEVEETADLETVREIQVATERGSGLTRQILAYSKNQRLHLMDFNLNEILGKYRLMLEAALGRGVALVYEPEAKGLPVKLDEDQFVQILVNLAVNARDAMNGAGTFRIKTGTCTREEIRSAAIASNPVNEQGFQVMFADPAARYAYLEVADSGAGISKEHLPKIFEPYFSTKEIGHGTGLGLAVVYGIVKQFKGYIFCASSPGTGAVFRVCLPQEIKVSETRENVVIRAEEGRSQNPAQVHILVVDDEKLIRDAVMYHLQREKFCVTQASNADEALQLLRSAGGKIDIVLSDVTMPGKSGLQLAEEMSACSPHTKIVLMSGLAEHFSVPKNAREKSYLFLSKPFSRDKLLSSVYGLLKVA